MRQQDRVMRMKNRIHSAAYREFGRKNYSAVSMDELCREGEFSKGSLYHYYKSKDELYLALAKDCFQRIIDYLKDNLDQAESSEDIVVRYFRHRMEYFSDHPDVQALYYQIMTSPPLHLAAEVAKLKAPYISYNCNILERYMQTQKLRPGISKEDALDFFLLCQDYVNRTVLAKYKDFENNHICDELCIYWMDIFLHGILNPSNSEQNRGRKCCTISIPTDSQQQEHL